MFDENNFNTEQQEDNVNQEQAETTAIDNETANEESSAEKHEEPTDQPSFISFVPPPENNNQQSAPPPPSNQPPYGNYQNSGYNPYNQNPQPNNYQSFYNTPPKKQSSSAPLIIGLCIAFFIVIAGMTVLGLFASGIMSSPSDSGDTSSKPTTSETVSGDSVTNAPGGDISINSIPEYDYSSGDALSGVQIADKVTPSIVGVLNYTATGDDFNNYYQDTPGMTASGASYALTGQGSGIIINVNNNDTEHTYIVTNQHVIDGASYVGIVLYDEAGMTTDDHYQAEVIGEDSTTDLALLRIEMAGLPAAELADSDQLKKGETVYAIGNPGGLELACSITQGIVSGINRNLGSTNFIQTDVAVNPGNSGGALVNQFGQVVGIISQKLLTVSTTDAEGLSFAIPTSVAKPILDDLLNYGYVTGRVTLNITCETVSDMVAYFNRLPNDARVRVTSVEEGSILAQKGLSVNDFIVEFNGTAVMSIDELAAERDKYNAGDTIEMKIYRYSTGEYHTITFNLEEDKGS